jgi:outer membrane lipoprotein carrier protein
MMCRRSPSIQEDSHASYPHAVASTGADHAPAHADDKDVARLTQLLETSKTLTANFSQLTLDGSGTQLQETRGDMVLQRPGLFYWHTEAPNEQTMVSDGKKVTLWDPDLEQATIKKLDERLTQTPALLLSGDVSKISQSFDISAKEAA